MMDLRHIQGEKQNSYLKAFHVTETLISFSVLHAELKFWCLHFDDIYFCFLIWTAVQMAEVTITIPTRLSVAVTG